MNNKLSPTLQTTIKRVAKDFGIEIKFRYDRLMQKDRESFIYGVGWNWISSEVILSEEFIIEFADKVNWNNISYHQKLSEDFIRKYCDKVEWFFISLQQELSEEFIMEFYNKLNFRYLCMNKYIDNKTKEKIKLIQRVVQS